LNLEQRAPHFITCAPGIEAVLFDEVKALRFQKSESQVGGVAFEGNMEDAWRANLALRSAIRVLRRVGRYQASHADELYDGARGIAWESFLGPSGTILVDARSNRSAIDHTHFVEQVIKDAVVDRFQDLVGARPSVDKENPDLRINAHLYQDRVTLSVDTSGHSLHRRGWRAHQGLAPLAETTACSLTLLSGWDRRAPLLDPFCGSGTILIEAALLAQGRIPGSWRRYSFEGWPGHRTQAFERLKSTLQADLHSLKKMRFVGSDRSPERIDEARANVQAAGLQDAIQLEVADALDFDPRKGWNGCILTNPPYGLRVGEDEDLFPLYREFGILLKERCVGFRLGVLSGNMLLRKKLGFRGVPIHKLTNGGIPCEFMTVDSIH